MNSRMGLPQRRCLTLVAAALAFSGASATASEVATLIKSLKERRAKVKSLHAVTTTHLRHKKDVRKTEFEYWELKTENSRKTYRLGKTEDAGKKEGRPGFEESLTVSDGTHVWSQLPAGGGKIVVKSEARFTNDLDQVSDAVKKGKARTKPGENILGMETVIVEIVGDSRGTSYKATYWLSKEHGIILKSSIRNADGKGVETESSLCIVNGKVADDIFAYSPPDGAQVIDTTTVGRGGSQ